MSMDLGIKGRTAFVGGSSSGLGEAVAKSLAAEGVSLVLSAIDENGLERVRKEIHEAYGTDILTVQADFTSENDLEKVIDKSLKKFGNVDILFNNTGGPPSCKFEDTTMELWDKAYRLLLMSTVTITRGFLKGMKANKWGRIINSTSIAVKQPVENLILSSSVRSAITGFARTLANEVARYGITVNCILPGYTKTQRVDYLAKTAVELERITYEDALKMWTNEIPLGRMAEPSEFADMVTFLASNRASYVTGQSIAVDGGWIKSLL